LKHVDGYRQSKLLQSTTTLTVRADAFKGWFNDPRQPRLVLDHLRKKGCLAKPASPKKGQGIVWAESQPQWPDGTRPRSIVIKLKPSVFPRSTALKFKRGRLSSQ
jgi:hypothetical protein